MMRLTIDRQPVEVPEGKTVLEAARQLGIDIPTLCYLEKCGPLNSCLVCLVKINGKLVPSCGTRAEPGMIVESESEEVHAARRTALELLFSDHVGDCLAPCHRLCPLGLNIPQMLRQVKAGQLPEAAAALRNTLPLAGVLGRLCHHPCEQGCRRGNWDDPAAIRDMERFVSDWDCGLKVDKPAAPYTPPRKPATGKTVAIVGAGPAGLTAAYYLTREGHAVTVFDRREQPGGSLQDVSEADLPRQVLEAEIGLLARLGVRLQRAHFGESPDAGGQSVSLPDLSTRHDGVLLAAGETPVSELQASGLACTDSALRIDPNTCQTSMPNVFAAGALVRPVKQLIRAMAEGRSAAECLHRFLSGRPPARPEKPFSSIMGRLAPGELREFLRSANAAKPVSPCDRCAGHTRQEAAAESARCLHCDCRSSGNCVLQHYAQVYGADASRYREERKDFEQQLQPGGVIFEPGKCILCGICVKLTELAREPLGLTFIGRGFDVRIAAPLNNTIEAGLQKVAEECVRHCPTGALAFRQDSNA